MGTRNLTVVISGGEVKLAQYGQWDGYPSGQGKTIFKFAKSVTDWDVFRAKLNQVKFLTPEEVDDLGSEFDETCGLSFDSVYPGLDRDTAADVLGKVMNLQDGEEFPVTNMYKFAADSLFCEWAYVLDLDKCNLEIYRGFNTQKLKEGERFFDLQGDDLDSYQPVKLVYCLSFEAIARLDLNPGYLSIASKLEDEE